MILKRAIERKYYRKENWIVISISSKSVGNVFKKFEQL